jgi:hypothetical protein
LGERRMHAPAAAASPLGAAKGCSDWIAGKEAAKPLSR